MTSDINQENFIFESQFFLNMTITKQTLNDLIAKGKTEQAMEQLLKMKSKLDKDLQEEGFNYTIFNR